MAGEEDSRSLAILFFNWDYNGRARLPGVKWDKQALEELLSTYRQISVNNADNVLQELRFIVEKEKEQEFERVHFHFSGSYCVETPGLLTCDGRSRHLQHRD